MKWEKRDWGYVARGKEHNLHAWGQKKYFNWAVISFKTKWDMKIATGYEKRLKDAKYMAEAVVKARKRL